MGTRVQGGSSKAWVCLQYDLFLCLMGFSSTSLQRGSVDSHVGPSMGPTFWSRLKFQYLAQVQIKMQTEAQRSWGSNHQHSDLWTTWATAAPKYYVHRVGVKWFSHADFSPKWLFVLWAWQKCFKASSMTSCDPLLLCELLTDENTPLETKARLSWPPLSFVTLCYFCSLVSSSAHYWHSFMKDIWWHCQNDFMFFRSQSVRCDLNVLQVKLIQRCRVSDLEQPHCRGRTIGLSRLHDNNSTEDVIVPETSGRWAQWGSLHPDRLIDPSVKRNQQVLLSQSQQTHSVLLTRHSGNEGR